MEASIYQPGEVIIGQGEYGNDLFILEAGTAIVEKNDGSVIHSYTRPGEYFGGLAPLGAPTGRREAIVRATETTRCVKVGYQNYTDQGVPQLSKREARHEPLISRSAGGDRNEVNNSRQTGKLGPKSEIDPHALLCNISLFEAMPAELTSELAKKMKLITVQKKRWVAREGDFGEGMFIVAEGIADVIVAGVPESDESSLRLSEKSLNDLRTGDCFAELSLFFRERRKTSVRSRVPSKVLKLHTRDFEQLLKPHVALYLGIAFMAQQRRIQELHGKNGPPDIFCKIAPFVCDDLLALNIKQQYMSAKLRGVPVWQLRSLTQDLLINWSAEDIDWLLAGGTQASAELAADPSTNLVFNNPKQLLDYNKMLLSGVKDMEDTMHVRVADTWKDWKREWSDEHQRFYFSTSTPRGTSRQSQWKPPHKSPWAPKELGSSSEEDGAFHEPDYAAGEGLYRTTDRTRSTSPWIQEKQPDLPKWLLNMQASIIERSTNIRTLFRNFDTDNSGTIDYDELSTGLKKIGFDLGETEWLEMLELVDPHNSGEIEITDLVDRLCNPGRVEECKYTTKADAKKHEHSLGSAWMRNTFMKLRNYVTRSGMTWTQAFVHFRTGRSGAMSVEDFYATIRTGDRTLSTNQMDDLFQIVDTNKDGVISLDEWLYRFEGKVRPPDWEGAI